MRFPRITPECTTEEAAELVAKFQKKIRKISSAYGDDVSIWLHVAGHWLFCHLFIITFDFENSRISGLAVPGAGREDDGNNKYKFKFVRWNYINKDYIISSE